MQIVINNPTIKPITKILASLIPLGIFVETKNPRNFVRGCGLNWERPTLREGNTDKPRTKPLRLYMIKFMY